MTSPKPAYECRHFTVTGRVQGVCFRDSARQVAQSLKITGYARNMPDGSVEVLACGAAAALERFQEWLHAGPPHARVDGVQAVAVDVAKPPSFTIA
ncbi:MAG TPA: acylphosphatase [Woeseiaceae bacterium]|nr:acylphosphatase [Woeseiaceae bacterium]